MAYVEENKHTGEMHAYCEACGWHSFGVDPDREEYAQHWADNHVCLAPGRVMQ